MIFAELIYKQNHSTPKIIPHHATKKPSETKLFRRALFIGECEIKFPAAKGADRGTGG